MSNPFDDGMIPPPPPPPAQDDGSAAQGDDSAAAQQAGQQSGQTAGGQQYTGQYDPNFAHDPYDASQAGQQGGFADPYAQSGQGMAQGQGASYDDPFGFDPAQGGAQGMPQGGYDPVMGQPMTDDGSGTPPPGAPPAPAKPSKPANFQLGTKLNRSLNIKVGAHNLQFDEEYFLRLLAGSISLTKEEKIRIIESIPKLRQSQIDELTRIFEEEKEKFAELGEEHVPQLEKLVNQHYEDWIDIEMKQEQQSKASDDQAQADAIRKQLGI